MILAQLSGSSRSTYLVTVSPEEVLGTNVLVWILGLVLKCWTVCNVLPVLVPKTPGVYTGNDGGWDHHTARIVSFVVRGCAARCSLRFGGHGGICRGHTRWKACAKCLEEGLLAQSA